MLLTEPFKYGLWIYFSNSKIHLKEYDYIAPGIKIMYTIGAYQSYE